VSNDKFQYHYNLENTTDRAVEVRAYKYPWSTTDTHVSLNILLNPSFSSPAIGLDFCCRFPIHFNSTNVGKMVAICLLFSAITYFAAPITGGLLGISALGPVAGGTFAGLQAGGVVAGIYYAAAQSVVMVGFTGATVAKAAAVGFPLDAAMADKLPLDERRSRL
jgi:hypothetical protein